jgi:hypothetical protein
MQRPPHIATGIGIRMLILLLDNIVLLDGERDGDVIAIQSPKVEHLVLRLLQVI